MGREGRALTTAGRLRTANARELVTRLGTGDRVDAVRSCTDLPRLGLLFEWAKKARLVRVAKGRLYAVAKAEPVLKNPLALWHRAFDAFFELRQALIGPRSSWQVESMLFDVYDDVLPDVLNTLYSLPHPMPWPRLRDSVHLAYRTHFDLGGPDEHRMWFDHADRDLRTVLAALEDLGALERHQGMADPVFLDNPALAATPELPAGLPPELVELLDAAPQPAPGTKTPARAQRAELTAGPVELIRLTDLGTQAVRRRLLAEGRDAPLVGELTHVPAADCSAPSPRATIPTRPARSWPGGSQPTAACPPPWPPSPTPRGPCPSAPAPWPCSTPSSRPCPTPRANASCVPCAATRSSRPSP